MPMIDIPVIRTERLRLTAFDDRHFEAYASMLADPDSTRFVGDGEPLDRMNAWRSMAMRAMWTALAIVSSSSGVGDRGSR